MGVVKDLCTLVPAVMLTATAVLGIATVMGLASWRCSEEQAAESEARDPIG